MPDLQRLEFVLDHLPDEGILAALERRRGRGRNDFPVRPMWRALIAGVVLRHPTAAALRRELGRNAHVERASVSEQKALPRHLAALFAEEPVLAERCRFLSADRGYDQESLKAWLWDAHRIRPLLDTRETWREDWDAPPAQAA